MGYLIKYGNMALFFKITQDTIVLVQIKIKKKARTDISANFGQVQKKKKSKLCNVEAKHSMD